MSNLSKGSRSSGKSNVILRGWTSRIISLLVFICIFSSMFIYLLEIVPRYILLSIPPPDYYQGKVLGEWSSSVRSVKGGTFNRFFVFREEAVVRHDPLNGVESWQSIIEYFDDRMNQLGWVRTEKYLPCRSFLPEANFLEHGENGYVYFVRTEKVNLDNYDDGDFVCLAVWKDKERSDVYNVVLLSIKPSFITQFMSIFSL